MAPGAAVQRVVGRPLDVADLSLAGRLPHVTEWTLVCNSHLRSLLWVAVWSPGAVAGRPVQGGCRSSVLWK